MVALYYTSQEGGRVKSMDIQIPKNDISDIAFKLKLLRKADGDDRYSVIFDIKVHSVFFVENGKTLKIWDAGINKFRPRRYTPGKFPYYLINS